MKNNGVTAVEHYLDDYITAGAANTGECQDNLDRMLRTCDEIGFSVNPKKLTQPSTEMVFTGILLDSSKREARISQDRLEDIITELRQWEAVKSAPKRKILSIIGKLHFICKVCRPGRAFLRRMIDTSKKAKFLHHHIKLNAEFRADVKCWLQYLPEWNGVSLFYEQQWLTSAELELYTDASDKGYGCYFKGHWCQGHFPKIKLQSGECSINWRELFAVVMALSIWGSDFSYKRLLIHCDNQSVVHILQKGSSKSKAMMHLVRSLVFVCMKHNIDFKIEYINTHCNDIADALSRFENDKFYLLAPDADKKMTKPVDIDVFM